MESTAPIPKFYINSQDNKVIRVLEGSVITYYQIKQYPNGDIKHSSGKTTITDPHRMQAELLLFVECAESIFKSVAFDYYKKEKENAEYTREYLMQETICPVCNYSYRDSYVNDYKCPECNNNENKI
jgi:predicted Zn-ribbon and HTH transcriptional regulator